MKYATASSENARQRLTVLSAIVMSCSFDLMLSAI
jgi:hypothetical protein